MVLHLAFLHADDLVKRAFALQHWSAQAPDAPCDLSGQPLSFLNVGTGEDLTIRSLAEQIAEIVGYELY